MIDKKRSTNMYIDYMFNRTKTMFSYDGLPNNIPEYEIEEILQRKGTITWLKHGDNLYALEGSVGGIMNEFNKPTQSIVTNSYLDISKEYTIDKDCVVMYNDYNGQGLLPINKKYAELLTESDVTLYMNLINSRAAFVFSVKDNNAKDGAEMFIKKLEDGALSVIQSKSWIDDNSLTITPLGLDGSKNRTTINEQHQYILALWFQELGVNAQYNMKREVLTSSEIAVNDNMLLPLIEDMLYMRKVALQKINEMFGTSITIGLSGVWKKLLDKSLDEQKMFKLELEKAELENEKLEHENRRLELENRRLMFEVYNADSYKIIRQENEGSQDNEESVQVDRNNDADNNNNEEKEEDKNNE